MEKRILADTKTVMVLGATGNQGGAVARALIAAGGWRVQTLSRNPTSPAAQRLAELGVELVSGNLDDVESLRAGFEQVHGVYSVQSMDQGSDIEARRGIVVADAAHAAGVKHFVYASVGGANRNSGVPHFESKWRIEQHIRRIALPATIFRPTFFMDNLLKPSVRAILLALMRSYVPDSKPLQMIAVEDIGKLAARAFCDPAAFIGKAQEIASDEMTRGEIVDSLGAHRWNTGLPFGVPRVLCGFCRATSSGCSSGLAALGIAPTSARCARCSPIY